MHRPSHDRRILNRFKADAPRGAPPPPLRAPPAPRVYHGLPHLPIPCVGTTSPRIEASHGQSPEQKRGGSLGLQTRHQPGAEDHRRRGRGPRRRSSCSSTSSTATRCGRSPPCSSRCSRSIAVTFDLWVYRPVNGLIRRSRKRLGGNYERNDPFYRDEVRELGYLVGTLIAVFTAVGGQGVGLAEHQGRPGCACSPSTASSWTSACWAREMNAALPYRETVERVLSRSRTFLHADFGALLLLDAEARAFSLEGAQGVLTPTLSAELLRLHARLPGAPGDRVRAGHARGRTTPARSSRTP